MASTSSQPLPVSLHPPSHWRYDVFLSFRGLDTRNNFTSHLYSALIQRGINAYKDDKELERGKTIEPELWNAIKESMFSIVIFSKEYASSPWCLDELVMIIDCMKTRGQTVLPIFYDVDPSDVTDKKGNYEKAFLGYKEEFKDNEEKVKMWKDALTDAANLSGWDVRYRDQSNIIKEIVERVWSDVNRTLLISDKTLVGMDFHIKEMKLLLREDLVVDVRFIGICGMGGIGKTTISEAVYDTICWQFEVSCFLANVKEAFKDNHGVISLQEQILSQLTRKQNIKIRDAKSGASEIRRCLKNQKILLIVDDVDDLEHLEMFVGKKNWYGPGSRVIITSRDRHLLSTHGVDAIREVDALNDDDALELFSSKAFKQKQPSKEFLELSKLVLAHAKGLPLALSVLGSFLNGRSLTEWRSSIDKLNKIPHKKVMDVLRISFDALEDESYKQIFLDIACCFRGKLRDWITRILDACGLYPEIGLQVLIEKSLISITEYDEIQMHDLLQAMGRYIAKGTRIWDFNDIRQLNTENKVEVVLLDERDTVLPSDMVFPTDFEVVCRLSNLRILICHRELGYSRMIGDAPTCIFNELRYFKWIHYPYRTLPSSFQLNKLVELYLCDSTIEQLWDGCKVLNCLKTLRLEACDRLVETPDLTGAPNLETMVISFCCSLSKIHPSLWNLKGLINLVLHECKILELPIQNLVSLVSLELVSCCSSRSLLSNIVRLKKLEELKILDCNYLNELPEDISELTSLKKPHLLCCNLGEVSIPDDIGCLSKLTYLDLTGNIFVSLPRSISQLDELVELILEDCRMLRKLPEIPPNLSKLLLNGCIALEELPNSIELKCPNISVFRCYNCTKLYQNNGGHCIVSKVIQQYIKGLSNPANPGSGLDIIFPGEKIPSLFSYQAKGCSISVNPPAEMLCGSNSGLMGFAACCLFEATDNDLGLLDICCGIESTVDKNELVQHTVSSGWLYVDNAESYHCWAFYVSFHQLERWKDKSISHLRLTFRRDYDFLIIRRCGIRLVSFRDIQGLKMGGDFSFLEDYDIDATHDDNEESSDMGDIDYRREFKKGTLSSCED